MTYRWLVSIMLGIVLVIEIIIYVTKPVQTKWEVRETSTNRMIAYPTTYRSTQALDYQKMNEDNKKTGIIIAGTIATEPF